MSDSEDTTSNLFVPSTPNTVAVRPLNQGMRRDLPSMQYPDGALFTSKNFQITTRGPFRRGGFNTYVDEAEVDWPPVRDLITFAKSTGAVITIVVDSKFIYTVGSSFFTGYYSTTDAGTITASGTSAVCSTDAGWTSVVNSGDVLDIMTGATVIESAEIDTVDSDQGLTLETSLSGSYSGQSYRIKKAFGAANPFLIDWTIIDNKLVFADSANVLQYFDGTTFADLGASASVDFVPTCVVAHRNRLFVGRVTMSGTDHRHRVMFSRASDYTDFTTTGGADGFIDINHNSSGYIQRLVPLGSLLICYMSDGIYAGRAASYVDQPVEFEQVPTGGIGLPGMKAVYPWLRGHFFIGDDNIYFLSANGYEEIGTPIVRSTITGNDNLWASYVMPDPANDRIVFGFPVLTENIEQLWSYNYKAEAWSYDEISCTMLSNLIVQTTYQWDSLYTDAGLEADNWDTGMSLFSTWEGISGVGKVKDFIIGREGKLYQQSSSAYYDSWGNISGTLETPDYDFGTPNTVKIALKFGVKLEGVISQDISFSFFGSTDRGATWKNLGSRTISAGDDETYVNFRLKGSTMRFKITTDSQTESYIIAEMTLRARGAGRELHYGPSD